MTFYSFDTSSLLNGRRDLLPPATFPTLWANIETMITDGHIRCVDVVRDELAKREDDVHQWARTQPGLFVPLSADVQTAVRDVLACDCGADRQPIETAILLGTTQVAEPRLTCGTA